MRVLATLVRLSAMINPIEAVAKHPPTTSPGLPMARMDLMVARLSRLTTTPARNNEANSDRQKIVTHGSVVSRDRTNRPPKLQMTAAAATNNSPRPVWRSELVSSGDKGVSVEPLVGETLYP
jgi:hypothetical protein